MGRLSDRELDRRLFDAVKQIIDDEVPSMARAVSEARHRLFPLHCAACGELPHDDGSRCRGPKAAR